MNSVTVITGASSGIGAALAQQLARERHRLVLAARREDRLAGLERELRAAGATVLAVRCDVTQRDEAEALIHRAVREFGRIDVLVNNAGRGHFSSVEDTTDEMIESMFAVNVYALWHTARPALQYMRAQRAGHIINVASIAGKIAFPFNSAYVAAKHACVGFTHALRLELVETGIHASVVCPAGVMTEWASATEGGSILELFSESGPAVKEIAADRGAPLPPIEGVMPAEAVAAAIVRCIREPTAEVYTHAGSREFVVMSARSREEAERYQIPVVLGERAVYERLKSRP
jgi:short-subunit dehydrogenase